MNHHQGRDTCAECGSLNADTGNLCQQCRDERGYGERIVDDVCPCPACVSDMAGLVPCWNEERK